MMVLRRRRLTLLAGATLLILAAAVLSATDEATWREVFSWDPRPGHWGQAGPSGAAPPTGTASPPGGAGGTTVGPGGGAATPGPGGFFAEFRLDRERARGQQLENLREMINNTKVDEATRREAAAEWLALTRHIGKELELEGLIRARGWPDCVVFLQSEAATVIVRAERLTQAEVARIGDIVVRGTGLPPQAISISARTQ